MAKLCLEFTRDIKWDMGVVPGAGCLQSSKGCLIVRDNELDVYSRSIASSEWEWLYDPSRNLSDLQSSGLMP